MDETPDLGWDQSWGFADPATAAAQGRDVVSMYLSHDASKNMTPADVKAYHQAGIGLIFNWESEAGRPLLGAAAGRSDAIDAVKLTQSIIAAVGYQPADRMVIYFSCDRDVSAADFPLIDGYFKQAAAVCHLAGFGVGVYGEAELVTHLAAAGITDAEWQTYAWSGGVVAPAADYYQYQNGQRLGGADVDFDRVIHPAELGAWWPPGHPLDSQGDDMSAADVKAINAHTDAVIHDALVKLIHGDKDHPNNLDSIAALGRSVNAVLSTSTTGVLARVASLQASVAELKVGGVDVGAVADAVATKLKALVWSVK